LIGLAGMRIESGNMIPARAKDLGEDRLEKKMKKKGSETFASK
jgi:hypothetical protein